MRQLVVFCLVACILAAALTEAKPTGVKRGGRKGHKGSRERRGRQSGPAVFCRNDAVCPEGTVCKSWDIEGLSIVYNGAEVTIRNCRPENETVVARPERLESDSSEEDKVRLPRPVMSLLRPACSVDGKMKECCENCTVGPLEITFGNATLEVFYCGSGDFDAVDTLNAEECKRGKKGSSESDESGESDESSGSVDSSEETVRPQQKQRRPPKNVKTVNNDRRRLRGRN